MSKNKVLYSIRLFSTSLVAGLLLVLAICYYIGDFSSPKIFEYMSWVGILILFVGASYFAMNNPYLGASMAITTQLRHNSKGQESRRNDRDATEGYVKGAFIAASGIIMIAISYFVLA
jgi:hypothetical protein